MVELTDKQAAEALKVWQTPWGKAVVEKMDLRRIGKALPSLDKLLACFGDSDSGRIAGLEVLHEACLAVLVKAGGPWPVLTSSRDGEFFEYGQGSSMTRHPSYDACLLACVAHALGVPEPKEEPKQADKSLADRLRESARYVYSEGMTREKEEIIDYCAAWLEHEYELTEHPLPQPQECSTCKALRQSLAAVTRNRDALLGELSDAKRAGDVEVAAKKTAQDLLEVRTADRDAREHSFQGALAMLKAEKQRCAEQDALIARLRADLASRPAGAWQAVVNAVKVDPPICGEVRREFVCGLPRGHDENHCGQAHGSTLCWKQGLPPGPPPTPDRTGTWWVWHNDPTCIIEVLGPVSDGGAMPARRMGHGEVRIPDWGIAEGRWLPIPAKPEPQDGYEPRECREPKRGESYFRLDGHIEDGRDGWIWPNNAQDGGRRWIARKVPQAPAPNFAAMTNREFRVWAGKKIGELQRGAGK